MTQIFVSDDGVKAEWHLIPARIPAVYLDGPGKCFGILGLGRRYARRSDRESRRQACANAGATSGTQWGYEEASPGGLFRQIRSNASSGSEPALRPSARTRARTPRPPYLETHPWLPSRSHSRKTPQKISLPRVTEIRVTVIDSDAAEGTQSGARR